MKIITDRGRLSGKYTKRFLVKSESGKHSYPSKKMFVEFLRHYRDIQGEAEIYSKEDWSNGTVTIYCELTYKVPTK